MTVRDPKLRYLFVALAAGWMVFIFLMSSSPGAQSDAASGRLTAFVQKVFFKRWEELPGADFLKMTGRLHYFLRKLSHFTEYAVLGGLLSLVLMTFENRFSLRLCIGFFAGTLYAVTDEIHQTFVPGREGAVFDVLVDAAGVFAGCLLVLGLFAMAFADGKKK